MGTIPAIEEDDEQVYIPEELFKHLLPEHLEAIEAQMQAAREALQVADKDIQSLTRLAKAIPTTSSLSYIYHRLRTMKFEATSETLMEHDVLTTAFIVNYSRLFVSGNGGSGVSRDQIPAHLKSVHDDIIELRNKRYAHNAGHDTVDSGIQIGFDGTRFRLNLELSLGFHFGGRDEWEELVTFLDAHMHERVAKILSRLKEKTGYEWVFPAGSPPDWVGKYGEADG